MPARSIDTATIAFGLVSIPVKIYSTSERTHELHFHFVHKGCGERLHQQYMCPEHGKVDRDDMGKGFELSKGNMVELDPAELKALDAVASDEIALAEFVPASAVDPLYVDKTYYLGPGKGGDRAYRLFRDALEDSELVGIAAYAARGKQYIVMVRPFEDGMIMHQLRYPDEIKAWSEVPLGKLPKAAPSELGLAAKIIEQLTHKDFDPTQYHDEVKERVRKLIAKKAKGGEIVVTEEAPEKLEVTDLMAALKASLGGGALPSAAPSKHAKRGNGHAKRGHAKAGHRRRTPARTKRAHGTSSRKSAQRPAARARRVSSKRARAHD